MPNRNSLMAGLLQGLTGFAGGYLQDRQRTHDRRRQERLDQQRRDEIAYQHTQDTQSRDDRQRQLEAALVQGMAGRASKPAAYDPLLADIVGGRGHATDPGAPAYRPSIHIPSLPVPPVLTPGAAVPQWNARPGELAPPTLQTQLRTRLQEAQDRSGPPEAEQQRQFHLDDLRAAFGRQKELENLREQNRLTLERERLKGRLNAVALNNNARGARDFNTYVATERNRYRMSGGDPNLESDYLNNEVIPAFRNTAAFGNPGPDLASTPPAPTATADQLARGLQSIRTQWGLGVGGDPNPPSVPGMVAPTDAPAVTPATRPNYFPRGTKAQASIQQGERKLDQGERRLTETGRHNLIAEETANAGLSERQRHNTATEKLGRAALTAITGYRNGSLSIEARNAAVREAAQALSTQEVGWKADVESWKLQHPEKSLAADALLDRLKQQTELQYKLQGFLESGKATDPAGVITALQNGNRNIQNTWNTLQKATPQRGNAPAPDFAGKGGKGVARNTSNADAHQNRANFIQALLKTTRPATGKPYTAQEAEAAANDYVRRGNRF